MYKKKKKQRGRSFSCHNYLDSVVSQSINDGIFITNPTSISSRLDETVVFECRFNIFPLPSTLYWQHDESTISFLNQTTNSRHSLVSNIKKGVYDLKIDNVNLQDDGEYTCVIRGVSSDEYRSKPAKLTVLIEPGPPMLFINPKDNLVDGMEIRVECGSSGGNPRPKIDITFNSMKFKGTYAPAQSLDEPTLLTVETKVNRTFDKGTFLCAINSPALTDSPMTVQSSRIDVKYPPIISLSPSTPYNAVENESVEFSCTAKSNPPPINIQWEVNQRLARLDDVYNLKSYELQFTKITRKDSGSYTCIANNGIGAPSEKTLELNVLYPPVIKVMPEVKIKEGASLNLTCFVDANPSPFQIKWEKKEEFVSHSVISYDSNLIIPQISRSDAGTYICTAFSKMQPTEGPIIEKSASESSEVIVHYSPGSAFIEPVKPIFELEPIIISCYSEDAGNPPANYRWMKEGTEASLLIQPIFSIPKATLQDAGFYTCIPFNEFGNGPATSVQVVVNARPKFIDSLISHNVVNATHQHYTLDCIFTGKPAPNITWLHNGEVISTHDIAFSHFIISSSIDKHSAYLLKTKSSLIWKNEVRPEDRGNYTCQAVVLNSDPVSVSTYLEVKHKPVPLLPPTMMNKVALRKYQQDAKLECLFYANPAPIFLWKRGSEILAPSNSQYSINERQMYFNEETVYVSELIVFNVDENSYDIYECNVSNNIGYSKFDIELLRQGKPDPPLSIEISEVDHDVASLTWIPGFDGGFMQTFEIFLNQLDSHGGYFSEEQRIYAGTVTSYTLKDLFPLSTYTLRVQSSNELGHSEFSSRVTFKTKARPFDPENIPRALSANYFSSNRSVVIFVKDASYDLCAQLYITPHFTEYDEFRHPIISCSREDSQLMTTFLIDVPITYSDPYDEDLFVSLCAQHNHTLCGERFLVQKFKADEIMPKPMSKSFVITLSILIPCIFLFACLAFFFALFIKRRKNPEKAKMYSSSTNGALSKGISAAYIGTDKREQSAMANGNGRIQVLHQNGVYFPPNNAQQHHHNVHNPHPNSFVNQALEMDETGAGNDAHSKPSNANHLNKPPPPYLNYNTPPINSTTRASYISNLSLTQGPNATLRPTGPPRLKFKTPQDLLAASVDSYYPEASNSKANTLQQPQSSATNNNNLNYFPYTEDDSGNKSFDGSFQDSIDPNNQQVVHEVIV